MRFYSDRARTIVVYSLSKGLDYILSIYKIFARVFYFRETSRMQSFAKIKPSRNGVNPYCRR